MFVENEVIKAIRTGEYDQFLGDIEDAIEVRRQELSNDLYFNLQIGDGVVLHNVSPKYLSGRHGTVVGKENLKLKVDMGRMIGRYQQVITLDPSQVRKLNHGV